MSCTRMSQPEPHRQRVLIEGVGPVAGETEGRERQAVVLAKGLQHEQTGRERGHERAILHGSPAL